MNVKGKAIRELLAGADRLELGGFIPTEKLKVFLTSHVIAMSR